MSFLKDFKAFAMRGNVVDLAVGVIIGAAFSKIVSSLVADVIMPVIGMILGGLNFTSLKLTIDSPIGGLPGASLTYGNFIQAVVDFAIIAFVIFLIIKGIASLQRKEEKAEEAAPPPPTPADVVLLTEIRDLLKNRQ